MQRRQAQEQPPPVKRRASAATVYHPARPRLGNNTSAAHADELPDAIAEVDEIDDSYYDTRLPTSARRYVDTRGNQVLQRGNKRIVIHQEPPPKRSIHWLLILGI